MVNMLLTELAGVSRTVSQTSARLAKVAALADASRSAAPDEVPVVVAYLSGELPQRQIGVGWAALRSVPAPAEAPSLTILAVDKTFSQIGAVAGKGSAAERKRLVAELFAAATADEQSSATAPTATVPANPRKPATSPPASQASLPSST